MLWPYGFGSPGAWDKPIAHCFDRPERGSQNCWWSVVAVIGPRGVCILFGRSALHPKSSPKGGPPSFVNELRPELCDRGKHLERSDGVRFRHWIYNSRRDFLAATERRVRKIEPHRNGVRLLPPRFTMYFFDLLSRHRIFFILTKI